MKNSKKKIGKIGEEQAKIFLENNSYKVLERNFRTRYGEIDIIVEDKTTNEIVFVEVKTRKTINYGLPEEAVNHKKQQKIKRTALEYLIENRIQKNWRIDVVSIILKNDQVEKIKMIKNITL